MTSRRRVAGWGKTPELFRPCVLFWQMLRDLFTTIWITEVIAAEACDQGWLRVVKPERAGSAAWKPLNPGVDAGEASAITLALHQRDASRDVLLLIDDRCGRAEARRQGVVLGRNRRWSCVGLA